MYDTLRMFKGILACIFLVSPIMSFEYSIDTKLPLGFLHHLDSPTHQPVKSKSNLDNVSRAGYSLGLLTSFNLQISNSVNIRQGIGVIRKAFQNYQNRAQDEIVVETPFQFGYKLFHELSFYAGFYGAYYIGSITQSRIVNDSLRKNTMGLQASMNYQINYSEKLLWQVELDFLYPLFEGPMFYKRLEVRIGPSIAWRF